jgi:nucleoside-diphosphate-sugar epimerase
MSDLNYPTARWLIVGCGYVGEQLVNVARAQGDTLFVLTRDESRIAHLQTLGVQPLVGHWLEPSTLDNLPAVDFVVVSVPHRVDPYWSQSGHEVDASRAHAVGLNHLLSALPAGWQKLIYLSTTGVYGQDAPGWIDEDTPVSPTRDGPRIAVAAEQWLNAHVEAERFTVLRLAGIYGPGRVPLADKLRSGEPLAVSQDGYLNLIHVSDIARMLPIVARRSLQCSVYLFSDGQPVQRAIFYRHLAQLCKVENPTFTAPDPAHPKQRRSTDKRINPRRIVSETGYVYSFPNYVSGLRDALGSMAD